MKDRLRAEAPFFLFIIFLLPFIAGWETIDLHGYLASLKEARSQEARLRQSPVLTASIPPGAILEKTTAAFGALKTVRVDMETWIEDPYVHIKSVFASDIQNGDNSRTNGRLAVSLLLPGSASTSQWVQAYEIRGIPFTWDMEKREWVEKELEISGDGSKKILQYEVLSSIFTVNDAAVDPSSIRFMGVEKRAGRECYVLQYSLARKQYRQWGTTGDITVKVWIDTRDFLPVFLRSEGKLGSLYLLQAVAYSGFNVPVDLDPPVFIVERVKQEKEAFQKRAAGLASAVRSIRGWSVPLRVGVEFNDRPAMRDYFAGRLAGEYPPGRLEGEGRMMKWFGFLPEESDYKEDLLNMQVSSTAALYDPERKAILLGDWLHPSLAEAVIVHELVHAFQDAVLDLEQFINGGRFHDNFDASLAYRSLLEGEATAVMMEYLLRKDGKSFKELGDIFSFVEETLLKKSQYMRENIVYNIYGYGANFIQNYLKQNDWNGLDALFKMPPSSMKQILHPYAYESGVAGGGRADATEFDSPVPAAWEKLYETRVGEFFIFLSLRRYLDRSLAGRSSAGWKNDRIWIYRKGARQLIVFATKWDNPKEASEFFDAYSLWMKMRFPGASMRPGKNRIFLKTAALEKFSCSSNGDTVMIVWGRGFNAGEFASFINRMYGISQPKT